MAVFMAGGHFLLLLRKTLVKARYRILPIDVI
nr:MAG TPA: Protein of unknown function (DUF2584) [Caudoviricetes sp.]